MAIYSKDRCFPRLVKPIFQESLKNDSYGTLPTPCVFSKRLDNQNSADFLISINHQKLKYDMVICPHSV